MATIESLVHQIADPALRARVSREVAELKKRLWGLLFERHLPENTRLLAAPIRSGTAVWERRSTSPRRFRVRMRVHQAGTHSLKARARPHGEP